MTLENQLKTASISGFTQAISAETIVHNDAVLTAAGAALWQASNIFKDEATALALTHHCDVDEAEPEISRALKLFQTGGDIEALYLAIDTGELTPGDLPYVLAQNYGPLSAKDQVLCETQSLTAAAAAKAIQAAQMYAKQVLSLSTNNANLASTLLYHAAEVCQLVSQESSASRTSQAAAVA